MISALLYLQYHSTRNRLVMRVKRLKQPKYLFGAIVGGLYIYWYFFRHFLGLSGRGRGGSFSPWTSPEHAVIVESIGALILFVLVVMAWIIPHQRTALTFTEAEVAFLFPAPISRRGLIHYKLLRSQTAILFTTFFLTLVTNRFGGNSLIHAAGWWLVLSTLNLHFLAASFAMTMLMDRGITTWQRRVGILVLGACGLVAVVIWVRRTMPAVDFLRLDGVESAREAFLQIMDSGPAFYLLLPFRLVVRPYLAPDLSRFLVAAGPALILMVLHYAWVARTNVAFEEASVEASKKLAERMAAVRAGNWRGNTKKVRVKRPPFALGESGPPAIAILWKNLISSGRGFTMRFWIILGLAAIPACIVLGQTPRGAAILMTVGMASAMGLAWTLLLGPQVVRRDFRQDLLLADLLKTYPLPGWQIALGEVLGPAFILTRLQLVLLIPAATAFFYAGPIPFPTEVALLLGAVLLIPFLNLITLQIPNAAVLLFPAWFQAGKEGPQGIEATGQRLIVVLGQVLVLLVALIPVSAAFVAVFFLIKLVLPLPIAIVLGAVAAAVAMAAEAAGGLMVLGWLFNRFDIATELNP